MTFYKLFTTPRVYGAYMSGIGLYIMANAYIDSKYELTRFREGKTEAFDVRWHKIHDDRCAARYGAVKDFPIHLMSSVLWPIMLPINIVPYVVVKMTPRNGVDAVKMTPRNGAEHEPNI